jgi:hypothetical protein
MMAALLIDALRIPPDARVDQRIPKKRFVESGAPTAADKRRLLEGIDEATWRAALKPTNIGVPAWRDGVRQYEEIEVLSVDLREEAKPARIVELMHRAIPYPVVLVVQRGASACLSLAHKRVSLGEAGRFVVESVVTSEFLTTPETATPDTDTATEDASSTGDPLVEPFLESLELSRQPARHLEAVYQGWIERVEGLAAARITGRYVPAATPAAAQARRAALAEREELRRELIRLRQAVRNETQMSRRVALNLEIQRWEQRLAALHAQL